MNGSIGAARAPPSIVAVMACASTMAPLRVMPMAAHRALRICDLMARERRRPSSLRLPLPPLRRRRLNLITLHRMLLQETHRLQRRRLELLVGTGHHIFRPVFDIDIWSNAFILDAPLSLTSKESEARRDR